MLSVNKVHNHDRNSTLPADLVQGGGKMTSSSATCDILNN